MSGLALAAAIFWLIHAVDLILRGDAPDLMWTCNLAGPLLALGCALRWRQLVAVPVLWLSYGTPLWLLDLFTGGELIVSSFGTHVGCLGIGVVAARRLGWPRRAWAWATGVSLAIVGLTRAVTPPASNINLAFRVWPGWETYFPSYPAYLALLVAGSVVTFSLMEVAYRRVAPEK